MPDADAILEQAKELMNAGRYAEATQAYMAAVQTTPRDDQAWLGLGLAVILQRQFAMVAVLADQRQKIRGDGFAFFHDLAITVMTYRLHPYMLELHAAQAPDSPYLPSSLYFAACCHLLNDHEDDAFALLARLKPLLAARRDSLPIAPADRFNIAYRQATLVEDADYLDTLSDVSLCRLESLVPPLQRLGEWSPPNGAPTILAACDGQYLERFGRDFLESARTQAPGMNVHLHVVEPTPAGLDRVAGLAGNLSQEAAGPLRSGAYFACSRFLVAPQIMAHAQAPLLIADVDILFTRPLADVVAVATPFDVAGFTHDSPGPCSRLPAVLTWFAATENGRTALEVLRRFILSKLETPWPLNWMLDQAGLMTMRRWLRRHRPEAAIGTLNQELGGNFRGVLDLRGDAEEKAALIRAAANVD